MRTHGRHGLRTFGVDLAWADATTVNETGVVASEPDGTIVAAGWTTGVDETIAWANRYATDTAATTRREPSANLSTAATANPSQVCG
jgi:hypothetical protein